MHAVFQIWNYFSILKCEFHSLYQNNFFLTFDSADNKFMKSYNPAGLEFLKKKKII